ncbi:proline rich transmembrane protein 1B-like [Crassostrea angulata]|uniref:proline rich transmembrane protein 1B-like n=1 Tax=Magallana angulata TaxID=2784310 RepID=UPI0022B0B10A|nr:proline rich transmembrane protein 1B-like [Crassostrea angulata]
MTDLYVQHLMDGFSDETETPDTSQKADGRRIHDYLPTSVLVACLCFYMPTGLLAVRYAHKARQSLRNGKEEEAERFSRNALLLILTTVFTLPILCFTAFVT